MTQELRLPRPPAQGQVGSAHRRSLRCTSSRGSDHHSERRQEVTSRVSLCGHLRTNRQTYIRTYIHTPTNTHLVRHNVVGRDARNGLVRGIVRTEERERCLPRHNLHMVMMMTAWHRHTPAPTFTSRCCGVNSQAMDELVSPLNLTVISRSSTGFMDLTRLESCVLLTVPPNPVACEHGEHGQRHLATKT